MQDVQDLDIEGLEDPATPEVQALMRQHLGEIVTVAEIVDDGDYFEYASHWAANITWEFTEYLVDGLGITDLGVQACYTLERHFGDDWVRSFLDVGTADMVMLAQSLGESPSTLDALRRRLRPIELSGEPAGPWLTRLDDASDDDCPAGGVTLLHGGLRQPRRALRAKLLLQPHSFTAIHGSAEASPSRTLCRLAVIHSIFGRS